MYILLILIHIVVCLILISTILLQAGRGGGLTDSFAGDATNSVLGTQAPLFLKRATEISAILFLITSLALGIATSRRGRSLFERTRVPAIPALPQAVSAGQQAQVPAGGEQVMDTAKDTADAAAVAGPVAEK